MIDLASLFYGIGIGAILGAALVFFFFVVFQGNEPSE